MAVFVFNWFPIFCFQLVMALVCYRYWLDIVKSFLGSLLLCLWYCFAFFAREAKAAIRLCCSVCLGDIRVSEIISIFRFPMVFCRPQSIFKSAFNTDYGYYGRLWYIVSDCCI